MRRYLPGPLSRRRSAPLPLIYLLVLVLGLAACASPSDDASDATTPTETESAAPTPTDGPDPVETEQAPTPEPKDGIEVTTASSEFGPMLFDSAGQAIYIWESEKTASPECYDSCEDAWPPVLTDGSPVATGQVKARLLGTTERQDGSTQVTYNDHPLYYYAHEGPGEVKCHNVATHGGLWWVVTPAGNRGA